MIKTIFWILLAASLTQVCFGGVPYFSNYPFHHHKEAKNKGQQEAGSIAEQSEQITKDRTHGIDIMDMHDRRKRDLGEEIEHLEIQKQLEREHNTPAVMEDLQIRLKRLDPSVSDVLPQNMLNRDDAQQPIYENLLTPAPFEAEVTPIFELTPTPMEPVPAPTDAIDQPTELPLKKTKVEKESSKESSESKEVIEEILVEGQKVQHVPPRPTSANEDFEPTPYLVEEIPPRPVKPTEPDQNIDRFEVEERYNLKKRDLIGAGSDLHEEYEPQSLPVQSPDDIRMTRARRCSI